MIRDWMARDTHLWQYEEGCRRKIASRRRDDVRVWIRTLRRLYATAVVKNSSHKAMKEAAKRTKELHRPARRQAHAAAPGEIIEEISTVWGRGSVAVVDARNTTARCVECGETGEHGAETIIECEHCGHRRDRDDASTRNMLILHTNGEFVSPTARKTTAKFAKRHAVSEQSSNASAEA